MMRSKASASVFEAVSRSTSDLSTAIAQLDLLPPALIPVKTTSMPKARGTVLVVDDEINAREALKELLQEEVARRELPCLDLARDSRDGWIETVESVVLDRLSPPQLELL